MPQLLKFPMVIDGEGVLVGLIARVILLEGLLVQFLTLLGCRPLGLQLFGEGDPTSDEILPLFLQGLVELL